MGTGMSWARRPGAGTGLGSRPTCHRTLVALVARLDPSRAIDRCCRMPLL
jgi:hypothetical protein